MARQSQQLGTSAASISDHKHLVHERRRIKLFALKTCNIEFYFQNNKAPKEKEAVLLTQNYPFHSESSPLFKKHIALSLH